VRETAWPAEVFGTHDRFTIMNYGSDSRLTDADKPDLTHLCQEVWSGRLTQINGTPVRLVRPFTATGTRPDDVVAVGSLRLR
jgi:hypothetical protein